MLDTEPFVASPLASVGGAVGLGLADREAAGDPRAYVAGEGGAEADLDALGVTGGAATSPAVNVRL